MCNKIVTMPNSYTFSAIVLGATGQVGREIVKELANNDRILKVTLLLRRTLELPPSATATGNYSKITQHIIDFDELPEYKDLFVNHDVVFCAMGTHSAHSSDRALFYKVDHHYVLDIAKLAKEGGCHHFSVITMKGASPHARLYYCKVKGETEEDLKALHFYRLTIYRPGLLLCPHQKHSGWLESVSTTVMRKLDIWRNVSIETKELGKVMVQQCFEPKLAEVEVYENKAIHALANK